MAVGEERRSGVAFRGGVNLASAAGCSGGFDGHIEFRNPRLRNAATVQAFTILHRAAPGIPAPHVSTIVITEDGTSVRSNIVCREPSTQAV